MHPRSDWSSGRGGVSLAGRAEYLVAVLQEKSWLLLRAHGSPRYDAGEGWYDAGEGSSICRETELICGEEPWRESSRPYSVSPKDKKKKFLHNLRLCLTDT